jgi:reductive dehalogenase
MGITEVIFLLTGIASCVFILAFGLTSLRENKIRAAIICLIITIIIAGIWFGAIILSGFSHVFQLIVLILTLVLVILFFAPFSRRKKDKLCKANGRFDERDVMFAREEYCKGSEKYNKYYTMHPEYREIDDKIRSLPELLEPGGRYYDHIRSGLARNIFRQIRQLANKVDGTVSGIPASLDPAETTRIIKEIVLALGADDVGIAVLNQQYLYSNVGRGPEKWGEQIVNNHRFVIAFGLEMDYGQVEKAPRLNITEESVRQYYNGAIISVSLAAAIRQAGFPSRAHIAGSNYQIILPAVAYDAGLGELGRFGYLINPTFGARIRLGAITTDLPLIPDRPIHFGVRDFCQECKKCAYNCPSKAIPFKDTKIVRGINKWPLDVEQCITYWRRIGTDCGLCMKVCPFSHPASLVHNIIRTGITHSSLARKLSIYGDDLFYGKYFRPGVSD